MKYKAPQVAAISFMTSFNRDRGMAPCPPGSAAVTGYILVLLSRFGARGVLTREAEPCLRTGR